MLFSKAIIQAELEANAPLLEEMAIKRERLRALRAKRRPNRVQRERRARSDRLENSHAGGNAHRGNYGIFGACPNIACGG